MRWIGEASRRTRIGETSRQTQPEPEQSSANLDAVSLTTLGALPGLLDCSRLPNGLVEFVLEDLDAPARQLFDIQDGQMTPAEPGQCVPWASISGAVEAWVMALGPERDTTALQLTGDAQLARRVLAALPRLK
jgi:hypothetical protein